MPLPTIHFTGFNGFAQFKNAPKIITSLEALKFESTKADTNKIIVRSLWNYTLHASGCDLYISGVPNGELIYEQHLPFEHLIKDVACAENFILVLLSTGIAYKINCQSFEITEINSAIIKCQETPVQNEFITHIAAGRSLTVVITNKNNVYNLPLKIHTFPAYVKIKKLTCGNEHCLILTTNGDLFCFGSSSRGQLGLGGLESVDEPVLIDALAGIKIIDVAAGGWHSAAVSAFNDLYVWGWNVNGQIGLPLYRNIEIPQKNGSKNIERQKCSTVFASPVVIDLPKHNPVDDDEVPSEDQYHPIAVSAGSRHTVIKIDDGSLMATGWNKYGQIASKTTDADFDQFHMMKANTTADCTVYCGEWCTFVITNSQ